MCTPSKPPFDVQTGRVIYEIFHSSVIPYKSIMNLGPLSLTIQAFQFDLENFQQLQSDTLSCGIAHNVIPVRRLRSAIVCNCTDRIETV